MSTKAKKHPALLKASEKAGGVASSGKVGKGNPPEAFKWRPGQSGNPSGLPSAHREVIVASVKEMLAQVDPKLNKSLFERLLEQCARRALQGSKWHMGVLLDYGLGKPTTPLEHSGSINYSEILQKARKRLEAHRAEQALLSAETPANGHSTPKEVQAAAQVPEQSTGSEDEQPAKPKKILVEPWTN